MHSIPGPIQSIVWVAVLTSVTVLSSETASDVRQEGLRFATIHGRELYLDLYVPETPRCPGAGPLRWVPIGEASSYPYSQK